MRCILIIFTMLQFVFNDVLVLCSTVLCIFILDIFYHIFVDIPKEKFRQVKVLCHWSHLSIGWCTTVTNRFNSRVPSRLESNIVQLKSCRHGTLLDFKGNLSPGLSYLNHHEILVIWFTLFTPWSHRLVQTDNSFMVGRHKVHKL